MGEWLQRLGLERYEQGLLHNGWDDLEFLRYTESHTQMVDKVWWTEIKDMLGCVHETAAQVFYWLKRVFSKMMGLLACHNSISVVC